MTWHGRIGMPIAGRLGVRLALGAVGPTHARLAGFGGGPAAIAFYARIKGKNLWG